MIIVHINSSNRVEYQAKTSDQTEIWPAKIAELKIENFKNLSMENANNMKEKDIIRWVSLIRRFKLKVIFIWFKRFEK